jgi:hypothetical protein
MRLDRGTLARRVGTPVFRHGLSAEIGLGQEAVVGPTQQLHPVGRVVAAECERVPVMELEPLAGGASPTLVVDVAAPAAVPLVDGPPDRRRDVA